MLAALDEIAAEAAILDGTTLTLADCQLAPMIDCFLRAEPARVLIAHRPALARWWAATPRRPGLAATGVGQPVPP